MLLTSQGEEQSMAFALDPVCKMTVDNRKTVFKSLHVAKTYFFCSMDCKSSFDRDPRKFLGDRPR